MNNPIAGIGVEKDGRRLVGVPNHASQKQSFCVTNPSGLTCVQFHGISVNFAAGNQPLRWFNPELSFAKVPS